MKCRCAWLLLVVFLVGPSVVFGQPSEAQLARWLKRYPEADTDKDGRLSAQEIAAFRQQLARQRNNPQRQSGAPREFRVDPGWQEERFPDHAVCYRTPEEIAAIYADVRGDDQPPVTSYAKPADGSLRIVGTGHSFMRPGYTTFPLIARAAGFTQPPLVLHVGGGITGSTRYKWEQENGIFQFDGEPTPKLLASIANAEWDVMMWGPYFNDVPEYYSCWIEFALKYNPGMKFYLSDAWPQLYQLKDQPTSEDDLTDEVVAQMGAKKNELFGGIVRELNEAYPGKVFILPTNDAMVLAAEYYHRGELPGVEGIHQVLGGKERSLWRDRLGHIGPGFGNLEGYVFYAAVYGRSPELIEDDVPFNGTGDFPGRELDRAFRKIAWQAVLGNPLSGVVDADKNGVSDDRE